MFRNGVIEGRPISGGSLSCVVAELLERSALSTFVEVIVLLK
jgi:hypothetical protein